MEDARRRGVRRPVVVGAEVSGRLRRRTRPRPEDGVRGLHSNGEAADFAGDGDPGRRAAGTVLGECTGTRKVGPPQRSRQRPRNRRPRHGSAEHRRTRKPPEGRQGTPANWGQHATGRRFRGVAPHILRLFRKGGLPAAARAEHPGQRRGCTVSTGNELPREGSRWLLRSPASRCRGEQGFSACAAVGRVRVCDSVRGGLGARQESAPRAPGGQAQCRP